MAGLGFARFFLVFVFRLLTWALLLVLVRTVEGLRDLAHLAEGGFEVGAGFLNRDRQAVLEETYKVRRALRVPSDHGGFRGLLPRASGGEFVGGVLAVFREDARASFLVRFPTPLRVRSAG